MLFQVLWQDIKGVVPEKYIQKHLADWMRETMFTEVLDGYQERFKVLCKVEADFAQRELNKLKVRFGKAMDRLRSGNMDVNNLYAKFMAGTYSKQVNGQKFGPENGVMGDDARKLVCVRDSSSATETGRYPTDRDASPTRDLSKVSVPSREATRGLITEGIKRSGQSITSGQFIAPVRNLHSTDINITLLCEQDRKLGQLKSHCCVKAGELSFELKKA